jgi:hypothetical protein
MGCRKMRPNANMPLLEDILTEDVKELSELGEILSDHHKKARHRRVLVLMLYEYYKTKKLSICLGPSNIYLIRDCASDQNTTRILEINCEFDDQYILGHARRIGLISDHNAVETFVKLLPSIKNDLKKKIGSIGDLKLDFAYKINEKGVV